MEKGSKRGEKREGEKAKQKRKCNIPEQVLLWYSQEYPQPIIIIINLNYQNTTTHISTPAPTNHILSFSPLVSISYSSYFTISTYHCRAFLSLFLSLFIHTLFSFNSSTITIVLRYSLHTCNTINLTTRHSSFVSFIPLLCLFLHFHHSLKLFLPLSLH